MKNNIQNAGSEEMSARFPRSESGFTLIELIAVMVILGILAAAAAPKFVDLQRDARIAYLNGLKGAIVSANQMLHAYAAVHGMADMDLKESGNDFWKSAVIFDGGRIKKAEEKDAQEVHLVFLNYGYVGITSVKKRNSSLLYVISRDSIDDTTYGFSKSVENFNIGVDGDTCNPSDSRVDICYFSYSSGNQRRTDAYIVPKGFKYNECSLHYHTAEKDQKTGAITPPVVELKTGGC